jgi:hypothetical protein
MTAPPSRGPGPECPRIHAARPRDSRALVLLGLLVLALPLLGGATGSIVFAREAIGPLVTLAFWLTLLVVRLVRAHGGVYIFEWIPLVGCLLVLQLLLDLHTPHLGDIVVAALHLGFAVAAFIQGRRAR